MGNIDPKTARQVWQRVTAPPALVTESTLAELTLYATETAALYQSLAAALSGRSRELAQGLWERQKRTVTCLRGMQQLAAIPDGDGQLPECPSVAPVQLAESCCRRAKQALTEYTARSIDLKFGPIFRMLAQREKENCAVLVSILKQL